MPTKPKALVVVLERHKIGLPYVVARLDAAALRKAWPEWANRRVKGEINGVALRTTLFPARQGAELVLVVNRKMQTRFACDWSRTHSLRPKCRKSWPRS